MEMLNSNSGDPLKDAKKAKRKVKRFNMNYDVKKTQARENKTYKYKSPKAKDAGKGAYGQRINSGGKIRKKEEETPTPPERQKSPGPSKFRTESEKSYDYTSKRIINKRLKENDKKKEEESEYKRPKLMRTPLRTR